MEIDTLKIRGLTKRYGLHRALAKVDLTMRAGKLCALLGPNGAGKSTLLGIVSTLVQPTDGTFQYLCGDQEVESGPGMRRHIGVLAHSAFIYPELTGLENLQFYARLYGMELTAQAIVSRLDEVGLDVRANDRRARTYSRGMLQRLAIARTLLHNPRVLLLDEPFTGLDREGIATLTSTLEKARAAGSLIVVVTHSIEALAGLTDHVVVIRRGKVVRDESSESPFSAEAMQDIYVRDARGAS